MDNEERKIRALEGLGVWLCNKSKSRSSDNLDEQYYHDNIIYRIDECVDLDIANYAINLMTIYSQSKKIIHSYHLRDLASKSLDRDLSLLPLT